MSQKLERHRILPVAGLALALLAAGALLVSCGKKEGAGASGEDKVLAKVDGTTIKQSDLDAAKGLLPAQYQTLPDSVLVPALLDQLIDRRIAYQAAQKAKLEKDPKVKHQLEQSKEDVLQSAYLRSEADKEITDAAVRDAYQQQVAGFVPQTEIRARHILTQDEAGIRLAAQRVADGEAFESIAAEMSADSSAEHGGDLGYFTREKMVKEFSDVAFGLRPGQISQPFKSQFGWHIVKVEDVRQTQAPPYEQVSGAIRDQMTQKFIRDKLQELRQTAKVERFDDYAKVQPPVAAPEAAPSGIPAPDGEAAPPVAAPAPPAPAEGAPQ